MKLSFQSIHCDVKKDLLSHVVETMQKLGEKHKEIVEGKLDFRESEDDKAQKKSVTIMLEVPAHRMYSQERDTSFERAFTGALKKMERQLIRSKGKYFEHPSGTESTLTINE